MKKGDTPADPIELIVRRVGDGREFREEIVRQIGKQHRVDTEAIAKQLDESLRRLVDKRDNDS